LPSGRKQSVAPGVGKFKKIFRGYIPGPPLLGEGIRIREGWESVEEGKETGREGKGEGWKEEGKGRFWKPQRRGKSDRAVATYEAEEAAASSVFLPREAEEAKFFEDALP
jgi:hypothetical protein